ncbi:gluconokinase [Angustibacter sp. Root456]|uniref:gluconokinase n=1 Tax=Angustibacter sp. Root456 TaxID=1736539 RepID=UPI0006F4870F|nr:gluconokinase [Angustibacter sp. Root456]KQX68564.1 gluconate kinase [Angustibacter sp. Root456]
MTGEPAETATTRHVVVMGVSGCGKTTVASRIAAATGFVFAEADEFHTAANVAKMSAGVPLEDVDRWPWLRSLARWMAERAAVGESTVIACSALKRSYRDVLADGPPSVDFVHLDGAAELVRARLAARVGHYMPASLLDSQVATLEPLQPDERGVVLDVSRTPDALARQAIDALGLVPWVHRPASSEHPG